MEDSLTKKGKVHNSPQLKHPKVCRLKLSDGITFFPDGMTEKESSRNKGHMKRSISHATINLVSKKYMTSTPRKYDIQTRAKENIRGVSPREEEYLSKYTYSTPISRESNRHMLYSESSNTLKLGPSSFQSTPTKSPQTPIIFEKSLSNYFLNLDSAKSQYPNSGNGPRVMVSPRAVAKESPRMSLLPSPRGESGNSSEIGSLYKLPPLRKSKLNIEKAGTGITSDRGMSRKASKEYLISEGKEKPMVMESVYPSPRGIISSGHVHPQLHAYNNSVNLQPKPPKIYEEIRIDTTPYANRQYLHSPMNQTKNQNNSSNSNKVEESEITGAGPRDTPTFGRSENSSKCDGGDNSSDRPSLQISTQYKLFKDKDKSIRKIPRLKLDRENNSSLISQFLDSDVDPLPPRTNRTTYQKLLNSSKKPSSFHLGTSHNTNIRSTATQRHPSNILKTIPETQVRGLSNVTFKDFNPFPNKDHSRNDSGLIYKTHEPEKGGFRRKVSGMKRTTKLGINNNFSLHNSGGRSNY